MIIKHFYYYSFNCFSPDIILQNEENQTTISNTETRETDSSTLLVQMEKCSQEIILSSESSVENETHDGETYMVASKKSDNYHEEKRNTETSSTNLFEKISSHSFSVSKDHIPNKNEKDSCVSPAEDAKSHSKRIKLRRPGKPLSQPNTPSPGPMRSESPISDHLNNQKTELGICSGIGK